jgi:AcrR family transcriptional regulator
MPPKRKFSKEAIIDTAFEIARHEGIESITIRKVAERMGGSIAPIYVNFATIDELKSAVFLKLQELFQAMMTTPFSDNPFLNIGIASIKFAREYKVLFRDLILTHNTHLRQLQPSMSSILELMKQDENLKGFSDQELTDIFFKMRVFQLGLSVMDVNGLLPEDMEEDRLIQVLQSAGWDVVAAARVRKNMAGLIPNTGAMDNDY